MDSATQDQEYLKKLTVLYVEDEDDVREQFTVFLKRLVGVLVTARDGVEGIEAHQAYQPDIIITDILMPNMDGLTMIQEIRKFDNDIPIIVLTAFEQVDYLKRSINIGVDKYVTKPVNGFQLQETLIDCAHKLMAEATLQNAARTDLLTGLANRWELMNHFNAEKSRAERQQSPLSIIIADIDHFKVVNDTFGHLAGDRVLKNVADTIRSSIRAEDVCGRWGGEEFLIMLPKVDLEKAIIVAEKLRSTINSMITEWADEAILVTISMGVAKFTPGMSMDECIKPADDALYRAKDNGRNRFEVARS